jgi:hypothetical protein
MNGPVPISERPVKADPTRSTEQAEIPVRPSGLRPSQVPLANGAQLLSSSPSPDNGQPGRLPPSRVWLNRPAPTAPASAQLAISSSPGTPLPSTVRGYAERRLGRSLTAVRIHTGSIAAAAAADIGARAYTVGTHIAFGAGEYRPDTEAGRRLLAHELTHVAQQPSARLGPEAKSQLQLGAADSPLEREAERISRRLFLADDSPADGIESLPGAEQGIGHVTHGHIGSMKTAEPDPSVIRRQALPDTAESVPAADSAQSPQTFSPGGKIWFKTAELQSPKAPAGPFEVYVSVGFEAEAEIGTADNRPDKRPAGEPGAPRRAPAGEAKGTPSSDSAASSGEAEPSWKLRAGPTHNIDEAEDQGAKAELEHRLAAEWPGWLEQLRPHKVKAEGELTGQGGELSFGAEWGDEPVSYELKFTLIGGDWKEGKLRILDAEYAQNFEKHFEWPLGGALAEVNVKAVVKVHAEPNWAEIAAWLAEEGITATAASAAAGVALAYVAWVGYGLYEMDRAVMHGRTQMMGINFVEGYADELAAATELSPLGRGDEVALLDFDWQSYFNKAIADYLADRISIFDAAARAKRAGRASILQSIGKILSDSSLDRWREIASRHRSLYGISQKSRSEYYKSIMLQQVLQGKQAGIELSVP